MDNPDNQPRALDRRVIIKLSIVFAFIYFFSTNGLASLPGITVSFLLKDVLKMTATAASYFGAVTIFGWAIKPLWGIISDTLPIFGYRRKSYLILTAILAAIIWFYLGQVENYTIRLLLIFFTLSSFAYAFMDVICDALMVEKGKPHNLTGRFQSVQWTSVYIASIISALAGGWVAENLKPQTVFSINGVFPLIILGSILLFIKEERLVEPRSERLRKSWGALKQVFLQPTFWLLGFFLFFWTFSPSFGTPFFYYSVDTLKFDPFFLGIVGAVASATAALGAILYSRSYEKINTRSLVRLMILVGIFATLFDFVYFLPAVVENPMLARVIYMGSAGILGIIGAITFLVMMNSAALAVPQYGEGTAFALLASFWNIGLMSSAAIGGYLFSKIGLQPLILVSAVFTAAAWFILPFMKFADESRATN